MTARRTASDGRARERSASASVRWRRRTNSSTRGTTARRSACGTFNRIAAGFHTARGPGAARSARAVQGRVGERARVLGRLEVREDARAGQAGAERALDVLDEVVAALDGPGARDEDVDRD